jgi:D-alanyl-D-alanine carboxypeptidase
MANVPLYSITKPYLAAAALLSFDPELRLGSVIPELPSVLAPLVLRDVLAHRSGLDDYAAWPEYHAAVEAREAAWPESRILERLTVTRPALRDDPAAFSYSNAGYRLVRMALEAHHGVGIGGVLDRLVLKPLDLGLGHFLRPGDWDAVTGTHVDGRLRAYDPRWVYHGSLLGDPAEAARGIALLLSGTLGPELPRLMLEARPVHTPGHPLQPAAYGLGLMVGGTPNVAGHGGGGPGFELFAAAAPDGSRWAGHFRRVPDGARGTSEDSEATAATKRNAEAVKAGDASATARTPEAQASAGESAAPESNGRADGDPIPRVLSELGERDDTVHRPHPTVAP